MNVRFPRGVVVDINNIPEDFDEQIRKSFEAYTDGTAKEYTYQDKLAYIDKCRMYIHKAESTSNCVVELMKELLEYQVTENGEIPEAEDYLSVEFMEQCFEEGRTNLYHHYTGDHHQDDKIMQLLTRAIRVVINYAEDQEVC